jgi:hypothetical protein
MWSAASISIGKSTKESRRSVLNWLVAGAGGTFADWLAEPPEEDRRYRRMAGVGRCVDFSRTLAGDRSAANRSLSRDA